MINLNEKEFDEIVSAAVARIPKEIMQYLKNVLISVRKRASREQLQKMNLSEGQQLLGMYDGVSLLDRSITNPPLFPDSIILFQEPLEEMCDTIEELKEQIELTIVHEVAHFLGMSEERLDELGYG
jgi:predicted Zn-dependent protease with MMP-like domain